MTNECRPPKGTEDLTYHWLILEDGGLMISYWKNGKWIELGLQEHSSTYQMADYGFQYLQPVAEPDIDDD